MLSPMHPETTRRLRAITIHTTGNVLLLYGPSYISGPIFMAPSSLCILTTSLSTLVEISQNVTIQFMTTCDL